MSVLSINPTFPIFTDIDGGPLENGSIYIGQANFNAQSFPITVYWDAELTQSALQPIRTSGGYPIRNGSPARLYVSSDYSIKVTNKNGSQIYQSLNATDRFNNVVVNIDASDISYTPHGTGAVATTVSSKLKESAISPDDFTGTDAQKVQAAFNKAATDYSSVVFTRIYDITGSTIYLNKPAGNRNNIHIFAVNQGGIKKYDSGYMFDTSLSYTNDYYFHNVYFDGNNVSGVKVFNAGKIIYLNTDNCQFYRCENVIFVNDYGVSDGQGYAQAIRSRDDTVISCSGAFLRTPAGFGISITGLLMEASTGSAIKMVAGINSTPYSGCYSFVIRDSLIEGLVGLTNPALLFAGTIEQLTIDGCYFETNYGGHIKFVSGTAIRTMTVTNCRHGGAQDGSYVLNETVNLIAATGSGSGATGSVATLTSAKGANGITATGNGTGYVTGDYVYVDSASSNGRGAYGTVTASAGAVTSVTLLNKGNTLIDWGNASITNAVVSGCGCGNIGIHNFRNSDTISKSGVSSINNTSIYSGVDINIYRVPQYAGYSKSVSTNAANAQVTFAGPFTRYTAATQTVDFAIGEIKSLSFSFGVDVETDDMVSVQIFQNGPFVYNYFRTGSTGNKTLVISIQNASGSAKTGVIIRPTILKPYITVTG